MAHQQQGMTKATSQIINLDVSPITVVIGASEHRFFIHSTVLEKSSEFFRAALKSEWIEGQEHQVKLPEDDPRVFKTYANWLYTGTLQSLEYLELAKLYVLGEKLIDSTFQDIITNAIVACSRKGHDGNRWFPGDVTVSTIYRNTPPASPARRLLVNFLVTHGKPEWMIAGSTPYEREFLIEVATAFLHLRINSDYDKEARKQIDVGVPCAYHKHGKEMPCEDEVMAKLLES